MINPIFPDKKDSEMSDRNWETYCCMVWCCNSLNSLAGIQRRKALTGDVNAGDNALIMDRAQDVIWYLLRDSGRVDEYERWRDSLDKCKSSS